MQPFSGLPSPHVQRSLTLIAKVIQSLANLNAVSVRCSGYDTITNTSLQTVQKEEFMRGVKDFLKDSLPAMVSIDSALILRPLLMTLPPPVGRLYTRGLNSDGA